MAGDALLYRSDTSIILIGEPLSGQLDPSILSANLKTGETLSTAATLPILDFRRMTAVDAPFLADELLLHPPMH